MAKFIIQLLFIATFGATSLAARASHSSNLYKWRDDKGGVHYGDAVPPNDARNDRDVINDQGITLKSLPGRQTPAEQRAEARKEAAHKAAEAHKHHDRVLLDTYTSIDDLRQARSNRLNALQSQIRVTSNNIGRLERQVAALETRISKLKAVKKPVPVNLTRQFKTSRLTLLKNRQFLRARQQAQSLIRKTFSTDIARFKALKARENRSQG